MLQTNPASSNTNSKRYRNGVPTVIVIFGASGDLTARKLIPAIYNLSVDNLLPEDFYLIGYGRKAMEEDAFREQTAQCIEEFSRRGYESKAWDWMQDNIHYFQGNYDEFEHFKELYADIEAIERKHGKEFQILFYISTPPSVFKDILRNLGRSGLAHHHRDTQYASKIVVEKPFGHDFDSAKELNKIIKDEFGEKHIYRIDHYLGKETVQDLLVQRFANSIFEPIWNRKYVSHVEITVAESIGVGSRGGYYDNSGALRDMIQNHLMQIVSLVAMEPPVSANPEDIRDEKVKLLKAVEPVRLDLVNSDVVRGQYESGSIEGDAVGGYLQEEGIDASSVTETFVAMRLNINNWRWNGVPFYVRSGKRMAKRISEVVIHFNKPSGSLFNTGDEEGLASNALVIQLQPDEGLTLKMNSKVPGLETKLQPINLHFKYAAEYGSDTPEAYERLVLDAILGDSTLFIRGDETEISWNLCTPILNFWKKCGATGLEKYPAGSWGPEAADQLLGLQGHAWRIPS